MAFSKAARFPGREPPSPGPASYSPTLGRPRVLSYTFGPASRNAEKTKTKLRIIKAAKLQFAQEIGHGGLATVHGGHLGTKAAAFKVVRAQPGLLADPETNRRALHEEAIMLHRLSHPQIVEVIGLVSEQGIVNGFVMERLGESLEQASSRGHLCWQRLEKAFGQIVEAGTKSVTSSHLYPYP